MLESFRLSFGEKVVTWVKMSFNLLPGSQAASILEVRGMKSSQCWNHPGLHMIPTLRYVWCSPSPKTVFCFLQRLELSSFTMMKKKQFTLVCRNNDLGVWGFFLNTLLFEPLFVSTSYSCLFPELCDSTNSWAFWGCLIWIWSVVCFPHAKLGFCFLVSAIFPSTLHLWKCWC